MAVKLYFFDKCGVCEPIRTILAYGGIDFEDVYIPMDGKHVVLPQEIKSSKVLFQFLQLELIM